MDYERDNTFRLCRMVVIPLYLWVERKNPDKVYWVEIISLTTMMWGFLVFISKQFFQLVSSM